MSYQSNSQKFMNLNPTFMPNFQPTHLKNYSNVNNNHGNARQTKSYLFDYEIQKAFISKEKEWLNSLKNPQPNIVHSVIGNTITKPNSSSVAQQKRSKVDSTYEFQQNLAKTVKHSVLPYRKVQPEINPQYFKASSIYGEPPKTVQVSENAESRASKFVSSSNQASKKLSIMSIDQIREVEKKQFSEKTIHKITSSASRNKLKTSSSKDSKGSSANIETKSIKLNRQTERYNKYINNELINIGIGLNKEPSNNIISPNLNVRRFGGSEPLQSQYQTARQESHPPKPFQMNEASRVVATQYANYAPGTPNTNLIHSKYQQNQQLTCKDSVPRQDNGLPPRIKTRSKSNLSRYSQIKQEQPHNHCLIHCDQKIDHSRQIEIVIHQNPTKSFQKQTLPKQKSDKKIHFVTYFPNDKNSHKPTQITPNFNPNYQTETSGLQLSNDLERNQAQRAPISFSGVKKTQQQKRERPQTQRKSITNFNIYPRSDVQGESNGLSQLIEEKMKKKPIRLTLQKRN